MPWDHCHYETAYAVFLGDWIEEIRTPEAVFETEQDAKEFIESKRLVEYVEECEAAQKAGELVMPESTDILPDAHIMEVRNCFVPVWNDVSEVPQAHPWPVPDYEREDWLRRAAKWERAEMADLIRYLADYIGAEPRRRMSVAHATLFDEITAQENAIGPSDDESN